MKKLKGLLASVAVVSMMLAASVMVSADTTTDLSSMTVYAVDEAGNKTPVEMDFSSTTYTYDITVPSSTVKISIEASVADANSVYTIEKEELNTVMDVGTNYTALVVTSASGATQKYELNTTRLAEGEDADDTSDTNTTSKTKKPKKSNAKVTVGDKELSIAKDFDEKLVPEGFSVDSAEYDGKTYACIKGEKKELTAFYLTGEDADGFYIYDSANETFYKMNNIMIKSRMYTVVQTDDIDPVLDNYDKETVTVIDQDVEVWVLDEAESLYLVYAMNWNGDTSLYCYDDVEKCFQRYIPTSDANARMDAANDAYDTLQNKYNSLVDKYNMLLKIMCGLIVLIIILLFVIINLAISKKTKKAKEDKRKENKGDSDDAEEANDEDDIDAEATDEDDIDAVESEDAEEIDDEPEAIEVPEIADEVESDIQPIEDMEVASIDVSMIEEAMDDEIKDAEEASEEVADETADKTPAEEVPAEEAPVEEPVVNETPVFDLSEEPKENPEDIKETLKSMLPDDDDDDDDDFEFIDIDD